MQGHAQKTSSALLRPTLVFLCGSTSLKQSPDPLFGFQILYTDYSILKWELTSSHFQRQILESIIDYPLFHKPSSLADKYSQMQLIE